MHNNTSSSQELSAFSLSASAVLGALETHTLSSDSSSEDSSLVFTGITVPDDVPSDSDILKNSLLASDIESDEALPVDKNDDEIRDNRQVLAEILLKYADFCKSGGAELDYKLLRGKALNLHSCGSSYIDFRCLKAHCEHTLCLESTLQISCLSRLLVS